MSKQSKIKSTKDKDREIENPKDNTTLKNNRKQIEWRRNKVRQLLLRGNTQSEISRTIDIINQQYLETLTLYIVNI